MRASFASAARRSPQAVRLKLAARTSDPEGPDEVPSLHPGDGMPEYVRCVRALHRPHDAPRRLCDSNLQRELAALRDPTKCHPCTQVTACLNTCDACELCIGRTTLPAGCATQTCSANEQP